MAGQTDLDGLVAALQRLVDDPGTRMTDGDSSVEAVAAFNALAAALGAARADADRDRQLRNTLEAVRDTLLDVASGTFERHAPRSYDGSPADVLAYLVNSTSDEVRELVERLEREHLLLERTQTQLVAAEKDAALGRLASGIAHELNQPLTVVTGLVDLLRMGGDASTQRREEWLHLMGRAAAQIAQIVDGVRTFGRPTPFQLRPTPPMQPLQRARALVDSQLDSAGIALEQHAADDLPMIMANGERLQQVFVNLLLNARDAMRDAGTSEPRLKVTVARRDDMLIYRFADNGPGVDPDVRERLFEPFFTTKEDGGTGLGLSISRGIIRDHGGHVDYAPADGGGGAFTVRIPLGASR